MDARSPDYRAVLRVLARHRVEFLVVGGVAAVLHGAPIATFDLGVVHARTAENVRRLLDALTELGSRYRDLVDRDLRPDAGRLLSEGHQLLGTAAAPLDLLGTIGAGRSYDDLLPRSVEMDLGEGLRVRVLDLETLIAVKEETGREKDRAVLPILRRTLLERSRG
jgi:hypothetical protein